MSIARKGHIAFMYNNRMLIWGGVKMINCEDFIYRSPTEFYEFELELNTWTRIKATMLGPVGVQKFNGLSGCISVQIDDILYVITGSNFESGGYTDEILRIQLTNFEWEFINPTGDIPLKVDKSVGWTYENKIYLFGGFGFSKVLSPANSPNFIQFNEILGWTNDFKSYDVQRNEWSSPVNVGNLPSPRAGHASCIMNDVLFIHGGGNGSTKLRDLFTYNCVLNTWSGPIEVDGPTPKGRSLHTLTKVSEDLMMLYGGISQDNEALGDCWLFNLKELQWTLLYSAQHRPRFFHTCVKDANDTLLIFGGCTTSSADSETSDVIQINLSPPSLYRCAYNVVMATRPDCFQLLSLCTQTVLLNSLPDR